MPIRLRSRRTFLAAVALSAALLTACASATEPASPASVAATPAPAKPAAGAAQSSPPAAAKPAATAAPANKAAAEADAARSSGVAAPAAAAAPPRPAAPQQPGAIAQPAPIQPPAPTPVKPAEPAPVTPAQAGRMVIYTTEVSVLVSSPAQLVNSLGDVVAQAGGYVAGVENKDEGGVPVTTIRLKIPPDRYESAMRQIRGLAVEVTSEKATTQDVT